MKKILLLLISAITVFTVFYKFHDPFINKETNRKTENTVIDATKLSEGFYIKRGNEFYSINNPGGYSDCGRYLIVENRSYNNTLKMEKGDEIVYISNEKEVSSAEIKYYEDLHFPTIGACFTGGNDKYRYVGNWIGDAKTMLWDYHKITAVDGKNINNLIAYDFFVSGLLEDEAYEVSCLQGTTIEKVKVKADCHILKDTTPVPLDYSAKAHWILSDEGYVVLNKNFTDYKDDEISTFNKNGFYRLRVSVSWDSSNSVESFIIEYKN